MKRCLVFTVVVVLIASLSLVQAQDSTIEAPACDLANLQNDINYFIGELGKLKSGGETDPVKIADKLQQLANGANALRAACDGLVFTGDSDRVIGPVTFPAGIYKAIAKGNENGISVYTTATNGECGEGIKYYSTVLFSVKNGEATLGSKGCEAIIEVKSYGEGAWTLSFERMSTG